MRNENLFKMPIKSYTEENDIVLDHCMGSGTTGVACKELKRKFVGFEKDFTIFTKAKERIENHVFVKEFFNRGIK